MISIYASILGWLVIPLAIVVAIVYLIARSRQNQGVTWRQALISYFYLIIAACVITAAIGAVLFLKILLDFGFDEVNDNDETLVIASVLAGTGLVIGALHLGGKRLLEKRTGILTPTIRRFYLFSMLTVSSIAGLVSIPIAIYQTIHYYRYLPDYPYPEWYYRDLPSAALATAIVVVVLWAYYLLRVLQELRHADDRARFGPKATPVAED